MALRSEKARFEKNVRQEHEADYISVLSVGAPSTLLRTASVANKKQCQSV